MHDNLIEDIECDGMGIPIFIVHRKYGHVSTNLQFETEKELQQFIIKMAHLSKSYVSYASPLLDSILPDGSRVNATLTSNVSTRGPTFTIRKFPQKPLTTIDLINNKTISSTNTAYLWTILEFKKNIVLIGPTAGGKTTLLNVISSFIQPGQRVVSIEDTREINLLLDNWIPQVTRPGFGPPDRSGKKYGEVTMVDLLKESFRQRPDYLIIGEVRGEEISLMFQGMASGHCSLSTVHSKSLDSLVTRLITPPISLDPSLLTSLDVIIVTGFTGSEEKIQREIKEIDEVRGYNTKTNKVEYNAVYKSTDLDVKPDENDLFTQKLPIIYKSEVLKDISKEHNIDPNKLLELITKREQFLTNLTKTPPADYIAFKKLLNAYKQTEEIKVY
jgi:flagellar protein FlaI